MGGRERGEGELAGNREKWGVRGRENDAEGWRGEGAEGGVCGLGIKGGGRGGNGVGDIEAEFFFDMFDSVHVIFIIVSAYFYSRFIIFFSDNHHYHEYYNRTFLLST